MVPGPCPLLVGKAGQGLRETGLRKGVIGKNFHTVFTFVYTVLLKLYVMYAHTHTYTYTHIHAHTHTHTHTRTHTHRFALGSTLARWWPAWWERKCHATVCLVTQSTLHQGWSHMGSQTTCTSARQPTSECTIFPVCPFHLNPYPPLSSFSPCSLLLFPPLLLLPSLIPPFSLLPPLLLLSSLIPPFSLLPPLLLLPSLIPPLFLLSPCFLSPGC